MKKILWLSHEGDLGGANKCLSEQIKILAGENYKIDVIVLRKGSFAKSIEGVISNVFEVYFYGWIINPGSKIHIFQFLKRLLRNTLAVLQIFKIIIKTKPDYVATNTVSIPVAAIAAKLSFKKHIWFIHEFGEEDHGYKLFCGFKNGAKLINWLSYKVAFNSEAVRKKYLSFVPKEKQFIAHNPVVINDIKRYVISNELSKDNAHTIQCLILGQIAPSKNQLEALKAIKILKDKGIRIKLNIVGSIVNPEYCESLQQFIIQSEIADRVNFLGYSESPFSLLEKTDLLLMCSRMEAFGRVTVEALKLGVPVIAANSGGSPEIVDDSISGYLYEAGNSESLAKSIQKFIENHQEFDRVTIAKLMRKKFSEEKTSIQLRAIFA